MSPAFHEASDASSFAMLASGPQARPASKSAAAFLHHQPRRLHLRIGLGDGELHALVGADGAPENLALSGIRTGLLDEPAAIADALGRDQDSLGVHAVQDVAKAPALLADQAGGGDHQVVEEELGGRVVDHGADRPDFEAVAERALKLDEEDREPVRPLGALFLRRGAGEEEQQVRVLGPRDPDLLAVHGVIAVLAALGGGAELGRVRARGGLGDAEGLEPARAARDLRQVGLLLRVGAVTQHRAHGVHLGVAGAAVAARRVDLLEDRRGRADAEPAAAVALRDQRGEEARVGERLHELLRVGARPVLLPPVLAGVARAQRPDGLAQLAVVVVEVDEGRTFAHSTVTDFARLRGWSTSVPLSTATW